MKYLKTYEDSNKYNPPEVGDYVIIKSSIFEDKPRRYIEDKIGKVEEISTIGSNAIKMYLVSFEENFPDYFWEITKEPNKISFYLIEFISWSNNKEELELELSTKKYNL